MPRWKHLLGAILAAGFLLAAGCYAPEEGTSGSSLPESAAENQPEKTSYETTEEESIQLRRTLQSHIKELGDEASFIIYKARGGDYADLMKGEAYDSLRVLGKSNGWTICLWRESLTAEYEDVLFMGKYAVEVHEFYYPYEHGVYVIKGDEVLSLQTACREDVIDQEAVYHMLPEDMQWGLKADHPMVKNRDPSLFSKNE